MAKFTVKDVGKPPRSYDTKAGTRYEFQVQFEGDDPDWIKVSNYKEGEAPKPGDEIEGEIENHEKFGKQLKRPQKAGNWGGASAAPPVDKGATIAGQAVMAASTMLAGTIDPDDDKALKRFDGFVAHIETHIRKESDDRMTHPQRKKLFALLANQPEERTEEIRTEDRTGRLTKKRASELIDELEKGTGA